MCVGDIVSFNAHIEATISVVGILLGGQDGKCDERAFTGDPELISKSAETLFMCSGATANAGNGTTLVIAVGDLLIAGASTAMTARLVLEIGVCTRDITTGRSWTSTCRPRTSLPVRFRRVYPSPLSPPSHCCRHDAKGNNLVKTL